MRVSNKKNNVYFIIAHSVKCNLNQSKRVRFFKNIFKNKSFKCIDKWYFVLSNILDNLSITISLPKKMIIRLAFFIFKYLIGKMKHKKRKNSKYLKNKYWIFKYYFIWTHVWRCLPNFKTFDTHLLFPHVF